MKGGLRGSLEGAPQMGETGGREDEMTKKGRDEEVKRQEKEEK